MQFADHPSQEPIQRPPTMATADFSGSLRVGGLVPFTTTDFPDRLAAVVFCQGCPWRCRYCQNPHLLPGHAAAGVEALSWPDVLEWLAMRRGLLDGVVFSGGEPTAQPALLDAVHAARAQGFAVGLHTAGIYPRRLARLTHALDWVGLDIKAPLTGYETVTGVRGSGSVAFASLELLLRCRVPLEVRTTVHPTLTPPRSLIVLACALADFGITRWVLQPFRPIGCVDDALIAAACGASLTPRLLDDLRAHVPEVVLR
jgi:anaerobic ribonucleoside-triphosphate reductase activating protein